MSYHTDKLMIDTHTDTEMQAMAIPKGQNWPRVKMGPELPGLYELEQWWICCWWALSSVIHKSDQYYIFVTVMIYMKYNYIDQVV